jgi:NTP pyrophosphatase (non-canonical NTP hydrolase)
MDANEYQRLAGRTLIDRPDFAISDDDLMLVWNALGLVGEAGEVADLLKKGIFHQHGINLPKVAKELGDVLWYVAALCTRLGLTLNEVMSLNIAKLRERYPDGYSPAASVARVDAPE